MLSTPSYPMTTKALLCTGQSPGVESWSPHGVPTLRLAPAAPTGVQIGSLEVFCFAQNCPQVIDIS